MARALGVSIAAAGLVVLAGALWLGFLADIPVPELLARWGVAPERIERYYEPRHLGSLCLLAGATGVLGIAAGVWLVAAARRTEPILERTASRLRRLFGAPASADVRPARHDAIAGVTLALVCAAIVFWGARTLPIRADEAFQYDSVASSALPLWVAAYISPNNHVAYSGLVWIGHFLWDDSVPGMRVWSLLSWALLLVVLTWIQKELVGSSSFALSALAASAPTVLTSAFVARGYVLGCLLVALCLLGALRARDRTDAALIGACGALALWTVPSHLYGVLMVGAVLAFGTTGTTSERRGRAVVFLASALVAATLLYAPILVSFGPERLFGNEYVRPLEISAVVESYPEWLWQVVSSAFAWPPALVLLALVVYAGISDRLNGRRVAALAPLAIALVPFVQSVLPPSRTLMYLVPLVMVIWGVGALRSRWRAAYTVLALLAAAYLAWQGLAPLRDSRIGGRSDQAQPAARWILSNASPQDEVRVLDARSDYACLRFYLRRAGWPSGLVVAREGDTRWLFAYELEAPPAGYAVTGVEGLFELAGARKQ